VKSKRALLLAPSRDKNNDPPQWESPVYNEYGYIKGTEDRTGEPIDVYFGDHLQADSVFVIDQQDPDSQEFDEYNRLVKRRDELKRSHPPGLETNWQVVWLMVQRNRSRSTVALTSTVGSYDGHTCNNSLQCKSTRIMAQRAFFEVYCPRIGR